MTDAPPAIRTLLAELDYELSNTRKTLIRIPAEQLDWLPHPRSMSFRGLATHLVNLLEWGAITLTKDVFDLAPPGVAAPRATAIASATEALELFDRRAVALRDALAAATDASLAAPWTLLAGGRPVFTMPRGVVFRRMVMYHSAHHRGQLTVYLRLMEAPLPALYGPSADETA
ncbi:MAG: DinB family protein [Planctomycetes bacterium]|nr:DinB family protein [Planctomycetota bacterium]